MPPSGFRAPTFLYGPRGVPFELCCLIAVSTLLCLCVVFSQSGLKYNAFRGGDCLKLSVPTALTCLYLVRIVARLQMAGPGLSDLKQVGTSGSSENPRGSYHNPARRVAGDHGRPGTHAQQHAAPATWLPRCSQRAAPEKNKLSHICFFRKIIPGTKSP